MAVPPNPLADFRAKERVVRRVVKIGGSLLDRDSLAFDVVRWLESLRPAQTFVLVGGGRLVDRVREGPKRIADDSPATHWHCVDLMAKQHARLRIQFPAWSSVVRADELNRLAACRPQPGVHLVSPVTFYRPDLRQDALPRSWATTSDSIAALLARATRSPELVLLKSCVVDGKASHHRLADMGVVDRAFPSAAAGIASVTVVRLPTA